MSLNLSQGEIKKRLIRLRNLENLHAKQGKRLEKYIRRYKEEKEKRTQLEKLLETALIRIGELEKMVFGNKKPPKGDGGEKGNGKSSSTDKSQKDRKQEKHSRNFFQRRARKVVSSETIMFVRSLLVFPFVFILAFFLGESILSLHNKEVFLFFVINGVLLLGLSKIFWLEGIHRINVAKANAMNSAAPFITLLFAWILLKDVPTTYQLLALVPIVIGAFFLGKKKRNAEAL